MIDGLAAMDVAGRVPRLLGAVREADVSALLVTNLTNIRYLTGFTGSAALLVVTADGELTFVTDGRYGAQAETQLAAAGVRAAVEVSGPGQREVVVAAVTAAGATRLALEADAVTWSAQRAYQETWFPDLERAPTTGLVADLRGPKDRGGVARTERATEVDQRARPVRDGFGSEVATQVVGQRLDRGVAPAWVLGERAQQDDVEIARESSRQSSV